ncbi:MAG: FAD-dependent oxidoreductase [Desulfobacteraceae bacterium]|nr:FAD-dependent oxidoreductase [Desulfobacteraceae bacterium]
MTSHTCSVKSLHEQLRDTLGSGKLTHPWCRQKVSEIFDLVHDVSQGQAGPDHLDSILELAGQLTDRGPAADCRESGEFVTAFVEENREAFQSHISTHTCPSGHCPMLTPAPCQMACPAGIDVPSYVTLVGQGKYAEAVSVIRRDNPFPWVCGLVCTHPCEFMCVRGRMDSPIAIMDLKGFAAEKSMSARQYANPEPLPDNCRKVCIVGAGPGGLTAAYYLALRGYRVTVLEALPVAGGMMMVGIPRYRLPREVIDREVAMIESLGVELRLNTRFGKDVTLEALRAEGYEAFLLAIGTHGTYKLRIPGEEDLEGVLPAVPFLRRVSLGDHRMPGGRVAVVGGGNVAIDAARTSLRLGCEQVHILYRRTHAEMPAHHEEVVEAEEEGVQFSFLTIPKEIRGENGRVTGIVCVRAELSEPDSSGRRRPVPVEGSEHVIPADAVIPAIGQEVQSKGLEAFEQVDWTRRSTIRVDTVTMQTHQEGVFAVGDAVTGPATVVEAISGGKKAASAIHRYFEGIAQPALPAVPVRRRRLESFEVPGALKSDLKRPEMSLLGRERRRITFQQVRLGLTDQQAHDESRRCLRCDICIRCGKCVEICRDKMGIGALQLGYLDFDEPGPTDMRITAERCIACGACATNCPTGAMQITDEDGYRVLSLCGTVLNRLQLEYCEICGEVLGPARYHDYIMKRVRDISPEMGSRRVCLDCARSKSGGRHAEITPPRE